MKPLSVLFMAAAIPFFLVADGNPAGASRSAEIDCEWKGFKRGTKEFEICVLDEKLSAPTGQ